MLVRYLPGKFDEKIPFPVQRKITAFAREGKGKGVLIFEVEKGNKEEIELARCTPLASGGKNIKTLLKMAGLFILLIAFCAGGYSIALKVYLGRSAGIDVLYVIQFFVSLALILYVSWVFKATVERYLFGGISFGKGEIFFQTYDEKATFSDMLLNERRK